MSAAVQSVEAEAAHPAAAKLSLVGGSRAQPMIDGTIGRYFDLVCARWPERPAIVARHQGIRRSFAELRDDAGRLAAALLASGLRPGDRIGLWSRTCYEFVLAQLAAAKAGLILVAINPTYRADELEYVLNAAGCKALILAERSRSEDFLGILRSIAPEIDTAAPGRLNAARVPALRLVVLFGATAAAATVRLDELMAISNPAAAIDTVERRLRADDPVGIQFTSGSTGAPKGVTLSHANILNNGFFVGEALRLDERDRICLPVPLYHSYGMVAGVLAAITHGATIILPSERFEPLEMLNAVAGERCTAILGVPAMFAAAMNHPAFARFDLSSLRTGIISCCPCPPELVGQASARMGLRDITIAYGMTETSPITFQSTPDDPLDRRAATVGRVHPHIEAKIVDPTGRVVAAGAPGELMIRGYPVMRGYWRDAERTREVIDEDGWLRTGDLATIDADGYCRIVGRLGDTIIRGGENVSPREVEALLEQHPKVAEAHAFGVPDDRFGEELCAWVKLRDGAHASAAELRAFCRRQAARAKVPRHIKFVDAFPVTTTGKVQRFVMRERTIDELASRQADPASKGVPLPNGRLGATVPGLAHLRN